MLSTRTFLRLNTALIITAILSGCQTTGQHKEKIVSDFDMQFPVGKIFTHEILIGGYRIPLPEGEFVVATAYSEEEKVKYIGGGAPLIEKRKAVHGYVSLANIEDQTLMKSASFRAPIVKHDSEMWYTVNGLCKRNNVLHSSVVSATEEEQDCMIINHIRPSIGPKTPRIIRESLDWASQNNISMPKNLVSAQYALVVNDDKIIAHYYFNPDLEGIKPTEEANWGSSDWHRSRIQMFPEKQKYVAKLTEWAEGIRPKIISGLKGDSVAPTKVVPPIQTDMSANDKPHQSDLDVELRTLKKLHTEGVLTDEEFSKAKNKLIDEL